MADAHKNDLAWAAGLFEGEGCIVAEPFGIRGRSPRVQITLGTTDLDVLKRFLSAIGADGNIRRQKVSSERYRPLYVWSVAGRGAKPYIKALLPWLGQRRGAKAKEALTLIEKIAPRHGTETHCPHGHPYAGENLRVNRHGRHCRTCERGWSRTARLRRVAV